MRHRYWLALGLFALTVTGSLARAQDVDLAGPSIAKDSLQVTVDTIANNPPDAWTWLPAVRFRINGPVASGAQLWMEVKLPSGEPIKFDIHTPVLQKDHFEIAKGGGDSMPHGQQSTYVGPADFTIHLKNEATQASDVVLYTGKFTIMKSPRNSEAKNPADAKNTEYYVDQDWTLPIGYLFLWTDGAKGKTMPVLGCAFWARGEPGVFEPHLFYKGQEVGQIVFEQNTQMGKATGEPDIKDQTSHGIDPSILPQRAMWERVVCKFPNVVAWDKSGGAARKKIPGQVGTIHVLKDNPGDYEIRVLRNGTLARVIKFTVGDDGKFDYTLSTSNKLNNTKAIVPVEIKDDQDGNWNRDAWKIGAFYGNPLTGFTPPE